MADFEALNAPIFARSFSKTAVQVTSKPAMSTHAKFQAGILLWGYFLTSFANSSKFEEIPTPGIFTGAPICARKLP
jgi:hypothetical protein